MSCHRCNCGIIPSPKIGAEFVFDKEFHDDWAWLYNKYGWENGDALRVVAILPNTEEEPKVITLNTESDMLNTAALCPCFFETQEDKDARIRLDAIKEMPVPVDLEQLFWDFDNMASKSGAKRDSFKKAVLMAIEETHAHMYDAGYRKK